MNRTLHRLVFFILLAAFVTAAYGINYMWLTNEEKTVFGDNSGDRHPFFAGDTSRGPIRSNDTIAIVEDPVFYERVITSQRDFWHGGGYNPQFLGPPPSFNAPVVMAPPELTYYRSHADFTYTPGSFQQMRCVITGNQVIIYRWSVGVAFDSTDAILQDVIPISAPTIFFFECPLELMGRDIEGDVTIASSSRIMIQNDVRVAGIDANHEVPIDNPNFLTIASEGDIKIANTWANGREDSHGLGLGQTDPESTDVVLTASIFALGTPGSGGDVGSFTFEQQNVGDSGYVCTNCGCVPGNPGQHPPTCGVGGTGDERGTAFVFGSIMQRRRGYLHRSCCGGTGYTLHLRWDQRLYARANFVLGDYDEGLSTDTVNFGNVPVGTTALDTAQLFVMGYNSLGAVMPSAPFQAERIEPYFGSHFTIPVSITPPHTGTFQGVLQVTTTYHFFQIPLYAHGIPGGGPNIVAYPNPFNSSTMFTFSVPVAGRVTLELFDILGRLTTTLVDQTMNAGEQRISFDAAALPSGLYFARLKTITGEKHMKLLLVK